MRQHKPANNRLLRKLKRALRENRLTRSAYMAAAVRYRRSGLMLHAIWHGRMFSAAHFDNLFARDADPWSYETDEIGRPRRALIIEEVSRRAPDSLLEIGCASGWMTKELSALAGSITAVDISSMAIELARERCSEKSNIDFKRLDILLEDIPKTFEMVICAGVLVYLPSGEQEAVCQRVIASLKPGGILILEHESKSSGIELSGDHIHALYMNQPCLKILNSIRRDAYEILVFQRDKPAAMPVVDGVLQGGD
jgi:2-polyprenyl-3-methyl-5-hydroxy-6-metoxy-1,4-benzoquinol methylase